MKTICIGRFETKGIVRNFACILQESMSKLIECDMFNRFLINVQQVCYIFEFEIDQEIYTRSFNFANELQKLSTNLHILIFSLRR